MNERWDVPWQWAPTLCYVHAWFANAYASNKAGWGASNHIRVLFALDFLKVFLTGVNTCFFFHFFGGGVK